jgi:putative phosphoribosyl transferase
MRYSDIIFRDRSEAGRRLGARLRDLTAGENVIVLGLPRGGVPVACEVAAAIGAPVDVLVVRKLGAPFNPELAVGSIASGGITVYNHWVLEQLGLAADDMAETLEREQRELERRETVYRGAAGLPDVADKVVVLVDDGAATGATMHAGVKAVRTRNPRRIIVALPTSSGDAAARLARVADEVVTLSTPEPYIAVGRWYLSFDQLSDDDVAQWLSRSADARSADTPRDSAIGQ